MGVPVFNVTFDSDTYSLPNDFIKGLADAITYFRNTYTAPNNVTINLTIRWDNKDAEGKSLGTSAAENEQTPFAGDVSPITASYDELKAYLPNLPSTDPHRGSAYTVTNAEAKALGLPEAQMSGMDATITFNNSLSFAFQRSELGKLNGLGTLGQYDFVGIAEHEISEVMGRIADAGTQLLPFISPKFTVLDLFRYSDLTHPAPTGDTLAYFSVDGGKTPARFVGGQTAFFRTMPDYGDWPVTTEHDAFGTVQDLEVPYLPSALDAQVMSMLGWSVDAVVSWKAAVNGDFATASNWNTGFAPGPGDNVRIIVPGTFTVASSADQSIVSLTTAPGGTLSIISGTFTIANGTGTGANAGTILVGDGKRYAWKDIVRLRRDCRPASQQTVRGRHEEPTLFKVD